MGQVPKMTNWNDPESKHEQLIDWKKVDSIIAREGGCEIRERQNGALAAPVYRAVQPKIPPVYAFSVLQNGLAGTGTFSQVQQFLSCQQIAEHARTLYFAYKPTPTNLVQVVVDKITIKGGPSGPCNPPPSGGVCTPFLVVAESLGVFGPQEAQAYPNALWLKCPAGT
jgi:hypothetical protein